MQVWGPLPKHPLGLTLPDRPPFPQSIPLIFVKPIRCELETVVLAKSSQFNDLALCGGNGSGAAVATTTLDRT